MNEAGKRVTVLELKRLLVELKEHRPDICIRYRLLGQMWARNFMRVVLVNDQGVVLSDQTSNQLITLQTLSQIMQFELDKPFQLFQPYFHYDVSTATEW